MSRVFALMLLWPSIGFGQAISSLPSGGTSSLVAGAKAISAACVTTNSIPVCTDLSAAAAISCTPTAGTLNVSGTGAHNFSWYIVNQGQ
jgi:hypothetical protein